ncbi:O-antigen ligase [Nitrobacter sp. Nb-311A]|uniref:O-antigen ligase family protein n=1 Tax=Nitrobacter sp. Nb-311A TaxID=314253 RepID=UPI001FD8994A|nr:O-antigen ligase family protein [Nitrobacter sp. Nb-311A]
MADHLAVLMAFSLPWSTTIFGVFTVLWLIALLTVIDAQQFRAQFRRPVYWLPVALFCLAALGMLWADATWAARIHAAGSMVKLLAIPLLMHQFERSGKGFTVFLAFLASSTVLLILSWLSWFEPRINLTPNKIPGVPVKNWITQGVEFVLCIFGSAALAIAMWRKQRRYAATAFALLGVAFLSNMALVASSRTALVSLPVLLLISTFRYMKWRDVLVLYLAIALTAAFTWFLAPNLRERIASIQQQYMLSQSQQTSVGLRLEYWTKSLKFIHNSPLGGHGTGSIRGLFEREAIGKTVTGDQIVANPHNQTLYFAIEWGVIGVILLYAMWITHFLMFTEMRWISWLGIIVVSQNVLGSLFNSHLSDYVEGWIYVMGVGVAGGMVSKLRKSDDALTGSNSGVPTGC